MANLHIIKLKLPLRFLDTLVFHHILNLEILTPTLLVRMASPSRHRTCNGSAPLCPTSLDQTIAIELKLWGVPTVARIRLDLRRLTFGRIQCLTVGMIQDIRRLTVGRIQ
jgi:hypothetical protein